MTGFHEQYEGTLRLHGAEMEASNVISIKRTTFKFLSSFARGKVMWKDLCANAETLMSHMLEVRIVSELLHAWQRWTVHKNIFAQRVLACDSIRAKKLTRVVLDCFSAWKDVTYRTKQARAPHSRMQIRQTTLAQC